VRDAPTQPTRHGTPAGLCGICRHSRRIETRAGGLFLLCERSVADARFPRYPPLPVLACPGFEPPLTTDEGAAVDPA
jgi:hypothetical protein